MSQYLLASHIHFCATDDYVVLLDLKRDKYVGLGRGQVAMLAACVKGWPAAACQDCRATPPASPANSFISKMVGSGMLTTDAACGKEVRSVTMPRPQTTLMATGVPTRADFFDSRPSITAGQLANFIRASLRARAALRWRPIGTVVARVNSRKARSLAAGRVDLEAARKHVAAFMHLRPWLFASRDACLADSLALVNFLARYRHFPTWVFGVQTRPFAAHCWVQDGDVVFNDTPDHVRRYTPILAI